MQKKNKIIKVARLKISESNTIVILFIIIGLLCASMFTSIILERKSTKILSSYIMQILAKYTLGINDEISDSIKIVVAQINSIQYILQTSSNETIRDELMRITRSNNIIRNAVAVKKKSKEARAGGTPNRTGDARSDAAVPAVNSTEYVCISTISVNDENAFVRYRPFVSAMTDPMLPNGYPVLLSPYIETMGFTTVLPCLVKDKLNDTYVFFEVNTLYMLQNMKNFRRSALLKNYLPESINIYNNDGVLIETTDNIKRKKVPTLQTDDIFSQFNSYDSSLELFTYKTKNSIWMMEKGSDIGLSAAVCIPADFISRNTVTIRFAIFFITLLSNIAIFLTLFTTFKVAKNNQRFAVMQTETRFNALQNKMRPHLFFNTLDNIVCAIEENDSQGALDCIRALAYILQIDLRDNEDEIVMAKQVRYIHSYVNLQEVRYKGKFGFTMDIGLGKYDMDNLKLLKFCVQPLVENCFVHSVHQGRQFTNISVTYKVTDKVSVIVFNDGDPLPEKKRNELRKSLKTAAKLDASHIGLVSINERIKLKYGKKYGLDVLPVPSGFKVRVRLPVLTQQ
ncbi:histidine kinase [Treponema parvum]|uniref:Histidine kinase n=1 Tax=Treponema parvum TaxID=138851 RepID=A0A975IFI1_9SPIR|nr:histidine kinase [Treponema parvum]QTQ14907.1 histidine kinase [Treponema parvum]